MIRDGAELSNDLKQYIIDLCCLKLSAEEVIFVSSASIELRLNLGKDSR